MFNIPAPLGLPACHRRPVHAAQCHQRTSRTTVRWSWR